MSIRFRILGWIIVGCLFALAVTSGCAEKGSDDHPEAPASLMTTGSPGPSEVARAGRVLARYLNALGALDLRTVRRTSTKYHGEFYTDENDPQIVKLRGFRVVSITPLSDDDPRLLQARSELWRQDYTAVQTFHVRGVYPHPDPGEEPVTDYDAIMVRTMKGDWLYYDTACCGASGHSYERRP